MLINSLSAFFAFTTLISPVEVSIILGVTAYTVFLLTPKQYTNDINTWEGVKNSPHDSFDIYMYLQSTWLGRQSLLLTFVPFFLIINSALMYADYRVDTGTYTIASWLTILVILALPTFWWTISVWRCSASANRLWAILARFFTIAVYYECILRIIIAYYYPQIWFNCRQLIMELGDCI